MTYIPDAINEILELLALSTHQPTELKLMRHHLRKSLEAYGAYLSEKGEE